MWGYHVWLRQPDGSRKQVRDFSFATKQEAKEALRAIQTAFRNERYGLAPSRNYTTTIETAINRYKMLAQAKRILRRRGKTNLREQPGYFQTLDRFTQWAATERKKRYVCEVDNDTLHCWIAAEVISPRREVEIVRRSTIRRRLNMILAVLRSAKESGKFDDLVHYSVPANPFVKF